MTDEREDPPRGGRTSSVFNDGKCVAKDLTIDREVWCGARAQLVFDDVDSQYVVVATGVLESVPVQRCKT